MALPYFFIPNLEQDVITLDEDTSKHVVSVLRMTRDEELMLTDGKGHKARARIVDDNRKRCTVQLVEREHEQVKAHRVSIGISLVKNAARFEWFLEKAMELGVSEILPLICERTEKEKFRHDRLQGILVSALLQSQQCWLPVLHEPIPFHQALKEKAERRYIAHCLPEQKKDLYSEATKPSTSSLILIGPEGDFTPAEINAALQCGFEAVALGATRLRTETAGMTAAVVLCLSTK